MKKAGSGDTWEAGGGGRECSATSRSSIILRSSFDGIDTHQLPLSSRLLQQVPKRRPTHACFFLCCHSFRQRHIVYIRTVYILKTDPPLAWKVHSNRVFASRWCCTSARAASLSLASLWRRSCSGTSPRRSESALSSHFRLGAAAVVIFGRNVHSLASFSCCSSFRSRSRSE